MAPANLLTIDVEDYFHVSAFETVSPPETWERCEFRVDRNTERVLALLAEYDVRATFFVLGWVARRFPELVKKIARHGHEIASHGYGHRRVTTQSRAEFRDDIRRSKTLLEDLGGQAVLGYRAPSYSIGLHSLWAYDELLEAGYRYDSSVFPVKHDFYGIPDWPRFPFCVIRGDQGQWAPEDGRTETPAGEPACRMLEIPITTLKLCGRNLPIAGGGYFRLFPYAVTRWGLGRINRQEGRPFVFYLHPWELDPEQPRMVGAGWKSRFRHYLNLEKTEGRLRRLLKDFPFSPIQAALGGILPHEERGQEAEPVRVRPVPAIAEGNPG
ncbi:MAG TPA: XrtA system polysaccharide deacetylase [Desulfuromonadales bacterium]|nr:XrtA system polysaccharide deacetylase [Desulfuromonadales bacterium]